MISLDHESIPKEELYQELNELLSAFCSDGQQQFCIDQHIITREELIQIKNTIQQIQLLLPTTDHRNNYHLRQTLTSVINTILHFYGEAFKIRNISSSLLNNNDMVINQYINEWHKLNNLLDVKKKDHHHLDFILDDLSHLSRLWKHHHSLLLNHHHQNSTRYSFTKKLNFLYNYHQQQKKNIFQLPLIPLSSSSFINLNHHDNNNNNHSSITTMTSTEDILTSILTSFHFPMGAYMVVIDKYNYNQLGFPYKKIGTRHIIFDSYQLSLTDIISIITDICDIFYDLFSATAQQHLSQTDAQVRKSKPTYISAQLKRLSSNIINNHNHNKNRNNHHRHSINDNHHRHHRNEQNHFSFNESLLLPTNTNTSSSTAAPSSYRLSLTSPNTNHLLQYPIPIPSFTPPPWMWPDLIKLRYPYDPYLFGLFRRHTTTKQQHQALLMKQFHLSLRDHHHQHHKRKKKRKKYNNNNNKIEREEEKDEEEKVDGDDDDDDEEEYDNDNRFRTFTKTTTHQKNQFNKKHVLNTKSPITINTYASKGKNRDDHADIELEKTNDDYYSNNSNQSQQHPQQQEMNIKKSLSLLLSSSDRNNNKKGSSASPPYTSISIEKLCIHLSKSSSQFYNDLYTHTKLRCQELKMNLQTLEWDMLNMYRLLQIASSNTVMERALSLVQEIDNQSIHLYQYHYQQEQQHQQEQEQQEQEQQEQEQQEQQEQEQPERDDNVDNDETNNKDVNEKTGNVDKNNNLVEEEEERKKRDNDNDDQSSISSIGEYILDHPHHEQQQQQEHDFKKKTTFIKNDIVDDLNDNDDEKQYKSSFSNLTHKTNSSVPFYQTSSSLMTPITSDSSSTIPNINHHHYSVSIDKKKLNHKRHSIDKQPYKQVIHPISITPSLTTTTTTNTTTTTTVS